ncbi:uncharacterized protein UHOR_15366 [Ustilago hordei]|uniref:Uncharacterized protein n=1 Tax=Ustilago hordei TaxID=120017 RepID=I2FZE4_USTHO|nr:uncharacterized protein UHOR_15366 [Ustilago hordei]
MALRVAASPDCTLGPALAGFLMHIAELDQHFDWTYIVDYILMVCKKWFGHADADTWSRQDMEAFQDKLAIAPTKSLKPLVAPAEQRKAGTNATVCLCWNNSTCTGPCGQAHTCLICGTKNHLSPSCPSLAKFKPSPPSLVAAEAASKSDVKGRGLVGLLPIHLVPVGSPSGHPPRTSLELSPPVSPAPWQPLMDTPTPQPPCPIATPPLEGPFTTHQPIMAAPLAGRPATTSGPPAMATKPITAPTPLTAPAPIMATPPLMVPWPITAPRLIMPPPPLPQPPPSSPCLQRICACTFSCRPSAESLRPTRTPPLRPQSSPGTMSLPAGVQCRNAPMLGGASWHATLMPRCATSCWVASLMGYALAMRAHCVQLAGPPATSPWTLLGWPTSTKRLLLTSLRVGSQGSLTRPPSFALPLAWYQSPTPLASTPSTTFPTPAAQGRSFLLSMPASSWPLCPCGMRASNPCLTLSELPQVAGSGKVTFGMPFAISSPASVTPGSWASHLMACLTMRMPSHLGARAHPGYSTSMPRWFIGL